MILYETKIYGIPNILLGLNYVAISKDDFVESLAKEVIKILKNETYKQNFSLRARTSMKKFNNNLMLIKWIKLILSIYNNY